MLNNQVTALIYQASQQLTVLSSLSQQSVNGTNGNDILSADKVENRIFARSGNDVILGNDRSQWIDTGDGTDFASGGGGDDLIRGGKGTDFLAGGKGRDYLYGNEDNDFVSGGLGADYVSGGKGDDVLFGGGSNRLLGLTTDNQLVSFDPLATNQASLIPVQGVDGKLIGIDRRSANDKIYGLSDKGKIYEIDVYADDIQTITQNIARATLVSSVTPSLLNSKNLSIDFNPTPDRLRVVGDDELNLRINVDTGTIADFDPNTPGVQPDTPLAYAMGDVNFGKNPNIRGIGYTNSFSPSPDTLRQTTLFGLDVDTDSLVRQGGLNFPANSPSPNTGQLFTVTQFRDVKGQVIDFGMNIGFDIATAGPVNFGYAVTNRPGSKGSSLYLLNLDLGAVVDLGRVTDRAGRDFQLIDVAALNVADYSSNVLDGGDGNDFLMGDAGKDWLNGGNGKNIYQSSAGDDIFIGGKDADTFIFNTGKPFSSTQPVANRSLPDDILISSSDSLGLTTIVNFQPTIDKIVLDKTTFTQLQSNPGSSLMQGIDFAIAADDASASAGIATIAYSRASGKLFYSETGIGSRPQIVQAFAQISNKANLTEANFQVVP